MVFQDYALYPQMSVERNMGFALRNKGMSRALIRKRVHETAERLGLEALLARKPSELSGGQRQRVALGRAIVREPEVFLMDEPLSNLDANLRVQMRGEIKRLQRELGTTTVYVTHDQVEAMTMGDRIAIMRTGELRQVGPPAAIYGEPADRFVGAFIGSPPMSFARFSVSRGANGVVVRRGDFELAIGPVQTALPDDLLVGVRPEDAVLVREETDLLGPLSGEVLYVEDLGREWFAGVAIDDQASLIISGTLKPVPDIGERVRFGLRPAGVYLFNPESDACLFHPGRQRTDLGPIGAVAEEAG
jgi:ABC-type sugar transport system ATPase subunit